MVGIWHGMLGARGSWWGSAFFFCFSSVWLVSVICSFRHICLGFQLGVIWTWEGLPSHFMGVVCRDEIVGYFTSHVEDMAFWCQRLELFGGLCWQMGGSV